MAERLECWEGTNFVTDPTWGDNAKGKLVDLMGQRADVIVRVNGGPNSGHTVVNEFGEFKFHNMPSGIFNPQAICVLADTVVVNPKILSGEIVELRSAGIEVTEKNLLVSRNAHLIMPWQRNRDSLREIARGGEKIGTTGQGIGPTYADRTERVGLRVGDLLRKDFVKIFDREIKWQETLARSMANSDTPQYDRDQVLRDLEEARDIIAPMITEVLPVIWEHHDSGKRVLGEAGQGVLLDLDRGGYPYVTSSHPGIAGFNLATGIPPREVDRVIAVTKAYTTRVGEGPLPTEQCNEMGDHIREIGKEFGATTGRPRRVGWLDLPTVKYGLRVGGATSLALTKIDIFDGFPQINICVGHGVGDRVYNRLPMADNEFMQAVEPVYETLPGWESDTTGVRNFKDLPLNAQKFVETVQKHVGIPIEMVSVGPERDASIYL